MQYITENSDRSVSETISLPTGNGDYYLTQDVTLSDTWRVPAGTTNLCLNGHAIILNTSSSDKPVIEIPEGAVFDLYDCREDARYVTVKSWRGKSVAKTGSVKEPDANGDGVIEIKGGCITGGNGGDNGGGIFNKGLFSMHGGSIVGNCSTNGGA